MKHIVQLFETLDSTNKYLENIDTSTVDEGYIVRAEHQTSGVGQQGNIWQSQANKNLTFSMLLKPTFLPIADRYMLTKAISLAMVDFLKAVLPNNFISIKWPNDIYAGNRKLAGVLVELDCCGAFVVSGVVSVCFSSVVDSVEVSSVVDSVTFSVDT